MVELPNLKEQQRINGFVPDEKLVVLFSQSNFDQCWKEFSNGKIKQAMPNLTDKKKESLTKKDCDKMRDVLGRFGIKDTGPVGDENLYVLYEDTTS